VADASAPGAGGIIGYDTTDALRHTWVIGPNGVGKSTLLLNLILQDLEADRPVVVIIGPKDLIADLLARIPEKRRDDIVVLDPFDEAPVGINQPHRSATTSGRAAKERDARRESWRGPNGMAATGLHALKARGRVGHPLGKNPGDVWTIAPGGYRDAHHAIFPLALAERMIAASSPEARCTRCRLPSQRRVIHALGGTATRTALAPTCKCKGASEPGLVLDPFMGSGTTAVARGAPRPGLAGH
jgi:hypothetical protein